MLDTSIADHNRIVASRSTPSDRTLPLTDSDLVRSHARTTCMPVPRASLLATCLRLTQEPGHVKNRTQFKDDF